MHSAALPDYSFRLHSGPELTGIDSQLVLGERPPTDVLELLQVAIGRCELSFPTGPVAPRMLTLAGGELREFAIAQVGASEDELSLEALAAALRDGDRDHLPNLATLWSKDVPSMLRFTGADAAVTVVNLRLDERAEGELRLDPLGRFGVVVVDAVDADSYRQATTPADFATADGACQRLGPWTLKELGSDANAGQDNDMRAIQRTLREVAAARVS